MSKWVRLTPGSEPMLALFALPLPNEGWYVAEGYSYDRRDDAVRVTEEEALAFAMLLPKVRALVEAIVARYKSDTRLCVCNPDKNEVCLGHHELVEALAPFQALLDD